jgi:hypothetical protein
VIISGGGILVVLAGIGRIPLQDMITFLPFSGVFSLDPAGLANVLLIGK